ncbi:hypothetical protein B0T11DRAFT_13395 [Plectosphaerella cucumerina]|uniref:Ring-like domain-containing protein n=1 Tax=Plectosphaerella cucumerina TaxID=40658 RepID=A0A8K0TSQ2_9PEZI|nr:hypothetical protein B0T11DRAFT_13395 [Plectosphaerella cucumerina]
MLEYFAYRKYKKTQSEQDARENARQDVVDQERSSISAGKLPASPQPLLDEDDEAFFARLLEGPDDVASRPPLPVRTSGLSRANTTGSTVLPSKTEVKEKEKEKKSHNPIHLLLHRKDKEKDKQLVPSNGTPPAPTAVPVDEAEREREELSQVLDDLNLGASRNNKAFALSADNNELVRKFTLVLKDLVNGVPTAVDDLRSLIDDRDGTLKRNYDKLPSSMKKLVAQLPEKMTKNMGPELLAVAAESQGLKADGKHADANMKDAAKLLFMPKNLQDLITKPSAIIGMLKAIVNFLKLRWPAVIGLNVVWSIAIFLLLLVLWYCHKRGRETRLERERSQQSVDGAGRVEELPDDPMLPAPPSRSSSYRSGHRSGSSRDSRQGSRTPRRDLSPALESPRRRRTHR